MKALAIAAWAVLRHPALWPTAVGQWRRMTPPGWWRRRPFLPVPDRAYLEFRLHTMYGDERAAPEPDDVVAYLRWCRAFPRAGARATDVTDVSAAPSATRVPDSVDDRPPDLRPT